LEPERRPARRRAASRALTATHPSGPNAEAAVDLPVHAPWHRRSCPLPWRYVLRLHGPQCRRTRAAPPNQPRAGVHAAHSRRTPAMPQPIPGLASTWSPSHRLNRLVHGYKADQSFLTRAPSRRRPPWMPHGELHPRPLSLANTCCFPLRRTPL
jgi:hypothetical protein